MQQRVVLMLVCCGLLAGCMGGADGGSSGGSSGGVPSEGGGSGAGEGAGSGGGDVTYDTGDGTDGTDGDGGSGDDGTGGDGSGGSGSGDGTGGDGDGGDPDPEPEPDPETVEDRFGRLGTEFNVSETLFQNATPYPVANFVGSDATPTGGSVEYGGQFTLTTYTISPYLYGMMIGDATISVQLDGLQASGNATGFVGQFGNPNGMQLVPYDGQLSLLGAPNAAATGTSDEVVLHVSGDLTHDIYTFTVNGIMGGGFSGNGGELFRGDANNEVAEVPVAVGDIAVEIHGNDASLATAVIVLERVTGSP